MTACSALRWTLVACAATVLWTMPAAAQTPSDATGSSAAVCGQASRADWTLLILLNQNKTDDGADHRLNEIAAADVPDGVAVIVEFHASDGSKRRFRVQKDTPFFQFACGPPAKSLGLEEDVRDLVAWGKKTFPSQYTALTIFSHGKPLNLTRKWPLAFATAPAPELSASDWWMASAAEIEQGLAETYVDVLGLDACLMASIEAAYQLRFRAGIVIASENLTMTEDGWRYHRWIEMFDAEARGIPTLTPKWAADAAVEAFDATHDPKGDRTLSAVDLENVSRAMLYVDVFAEALTAEIRLPGRRTIVESIRGNLETYTLGRYRAQVDLIRFATLVADETRFSEVLRTAAARASQHVAAAVSRAYAGRAVQGAWGSHGLSIFFPRDGYYCDDRAFGYVDDSPLKFVHEGRWAGFVAAFYSGPCPPRNVVIFSR